MIEIRNNRLNVRISDPGEFYRGSRFDWNGFVTDVVLDKKHVFCADESLIPGMGTGGRGLCNEFGIQNPVGYHDSKTGEGFPKLGVGILTRTGEEDYDFFKPYPIEPFKTSVSHTGTSARFSTEALECRGYAVSYEKEISINGNRLTVSYRLANVGEKPVETIEYCHNFVSVDGKNIGPGYELRFPFNPVAEPVPDVITLDGSRISWKYVPDNEFYLLPGGFNSKASGLYWELVDVESGVGMREECIFPVERIAIWGKTHVVSTEMFLRINMLPGEEMAWKRVFTFFS